MSTSEHTSERANGAPERPAADPGGALAAPSGARGRARRPLPWRRWLEIALLAGPGTVVFVTFVIVPVLMAGYYGFFKWSGYGAPTEFVGLRNYELILTDPAFLEALGHNGFILVMSLVLQGPAAVAMALLLNRRMRGRSLIRVLIFVPYVLSEVIVAIGWSLMLHTTGAVNAVLDGAGLGFLTADWLADPDIAIWALMAVLVWKYIGFAVILMLAGLQGIPDELREAAAIDGASYWKTQWYITLPLLGPTIRIWAFLSVIGSLQVFDLVYVIWGQYVADTAGTSTMATYMVVNGRISGAYGYGSAVAVVIFLISLVVALAYQRFLLRRDTEGALTGGAA